MRMGGSLRRRREAGVSGRKRRSDRGSSEPLGPLAAKVAGLALAGWIVGWVIATQVVFPAPPPPTDLVEVPDVRGLGIAVGSERLSGAGLELGVVDSILHPSVARDLILGQSPLPGQLARPGSPVRVTRSRGPQLRAVPDVRRVAADRARIVLETSGFHVSVDSMEAEIPRGRVVRTVPSADSVMALPAEIRVLVSTGPPVVAMPLLLGLEEAEARSVIDSLGLVVGEVEEVFRFGRDQGIVVEQEPPADTPLERGSAVRMAVGRRGG